MEQLIINTYTMYFNKRGSMIWLYKSISNILQIKIAIYMKWQAFVQINYYVSKKKYCNMLQWFIVGLLAFEGKFKMHLLSFSKLMYRFRTLGLWFMIKQLPLQRLTCIFYMVYSLLIYCQEDKVNACCYIRRISLRRYPFFCGVSFCRKTHLL